MKLISRPLFHAWLLLSGIAIAATVLISSVAYSQTPSDEEDLTRARKANEEAQTEYYRLQTEKLRERPSPKTLWESLEENPGNIFAVLAALVAFISFYYNYRVTIQNQRDTQFYEALKRFGDKDSPTVRCSAAGMLSQMAQNAAPISFPTDQRLSRTLMLERRLAVSARPRHLQYFRTAFDQLLAGLLLEENLVCLTALTDAIRELIPFDPKMAINELYEANIELQTDYCVLLARLWAAWRITPPTDMLKKPWDRAAHLAGYDKWVLKDFIARHEHLFSNSLERYSSSYDPLLPGDVRGVLAEIEQSLRIASRRLALNVQLVCVALHQPLRQQVRELRFYDLFLVGGDLTDADLRFVSFGTSQLTGVPFYSANLTKAGFVDAEMKGTGLFKANLTDASLVRARLELAGLKEANLTRTRMHSAKIDDSTKLDGANWWTADFFHYLPAERNNVDTALLENLFRRYGGAVPEDPEQIHPSVRLFLEKRKHAHQSDIKRDE